MKYLLFLIFSSMESFSIVMLGLMLFRFRLNSNNILRAMSIGIILSIVSLILDLFHLNNISPLIQLLVMILLVSLNFNSKLIRSILIAFTSYVLFAVVQTLFILILQYFNIVSLDELMPYTSKGYMIQFFSFVILLLISSHIRKNRSGFSFIPEESLKNKVKYSNKIFLLLMGTSILLISGFYYEYKSSNYVLFFEIFFVAVSLVSIILLYIALKRDEEESVD